MLLRPSVFRLLIFLVAYMEALAFRGLADPPTNKHADKIVIYKSKRSLTLLSGGGVMKSYKVALGTQPVDAKDRQGDHKTPSIARFPTASFIARSTPLAQVRRTGKERRSWV
jgi:hypothetical protein